MNYRMLFAAAAAALAWAGATFAAPPPMVPGVQNPITPKFIPYPRLPGIRLPIPPERCTSLRTFALPMTTIISAELYAATPWTFFGGLGDTIRLPAVCRVIGFASPTPESRIGFEVWIPFDGSYRNRYLQVGNGGFSGVIPFDALADGVSRGYATAGTDDGHVGGEAEFAAVHMNKIIDYGYRSLPETASRAKAITAAAVGSAPVRSYFHGCSNGGRQALMVAQRYYEQFDGIAAGAPANYFTHQFASFAWNAQQVYAPLPDPPVRRLAPERLSILSEGVRAQCAGRDGGLDSDRFLTNPLACRVNFELLTCPGSSTAGCLTADEVSIIKNIYAGPTHPRTRMQIYPGLEPGAEAFLFNWPIWITGPAFEYPFSLQAKFGSQFFWHFFGNPTLADLRNVDVPVRVAEADTRFGMILNAVETDLRPFYDRGGKLLQYHGFDDAAVAPKNSINYWSGVSSRMRTLGLTRADIDNFYRLFMVPGLGHCLLGEGANEFGNGIRGSAMDSRHDLMLALERWVEHGVAPERLIARHREPFFERPLCPYPKLPRYNGSGVATDAANWSCVAPRSFQTKVPPFEPRPPFRVPIQPDPAPSRKPGS